MALTRTVNSLSSMLANCSLHSSLTKTLTERACLHTTSPLSKKKNMPFNGKLRFVLQGIDMEKYTTRPLPFPKAGGRDLLTGRVVNKREGGGSRQKWRWVDYKRVGPTSGSPLVEKVQRIQTDPHRTAHIALVASGNHKRYIIATENMKVGDLVKTHGDIPDVPVRGAEMDAYPVGAMALGTVIHNIEMVPNGGGKLARAAGTCGTIVRKVNDMVVIRAPSRRDFCISKDCMATIGRVSNVDNNKEIIGSPNRMRWLGIRPRSGLRHRKTGRDGRKKKRTKPMLVINPDRPRNADNIFSFD